MQLEMLEIWLIFVAQQVDRDLVQIVNEESEPRNSGRMNPHAAVGKVADARDSSDDEGHVFAGLNSHGRIRVTS